MDGLSRSLGVGPTIELDGERLEVSPKILRHYALIEAEIIKQRGNPFDLIRAAKEALHDCPEIIEQFVTRAFDEAKRWRIVTLLEIGEWMDQTASGWVFILWLAVRDNNRETWTFERVSNAYWDQFERLSRTQGELAAEAWKQELVNALNQADGTDELGNSTGSGLKGKNPDQTSPSPGTSSSSSSSTNEDGPKSESVA